MTKDARLRPVLRDVQGDNGEGIVDDRLTGRVQVGLGLSGRL